MDVGSQRGAEAGHIVRVVIYNKWGCPPGIIFDLYHHEWGKQAIMKGAHQEILGARNPEETTDQSEIS